MAHGEAVVALKRWLVWARRCRIRAFIDLAAKITRHRDRILAAIEHDLSNALVESTNTKRNRSSGPLGPEPKPSSSP